MINHSFFISRNHTYQTIFNKAKRPDKQETILKKSSFIIFFSIVLTVYALVNYYIFISGWNVLPASHKTAYLITFVVLSLSYLAGRFLERASPGGLSTALIWVGSFWLAAMVYFLLFVVVIDLLRLINLFLNFIPAGYGFEALLAVSTAVIIIVFFGFLNARTPRVKSLELNINKPAGDLKSLTLAIASDIHLGTIISKTRLEKIVKIVNSLNADLVLLPGDVVDEDIGPVIRQNQGETIRKITAKYGVYAITGNHEYIGGAEPACSYLEEHGIIELRDRYVKIADNIYIAGREDRARRGFTGKPRKLLSEVMDGIDKSAPIILMDHQPVKLEEAELAGVDLQLSGHTHHGQLWPFNFITKKIYELSWGYKKRGSTHYYVSCGAGTWGPPVRTGNTPEIIKIILNFV